MSITFRVGKYIDPSGFGLAVVDVPELDPEKNISLLDYSHKWEENVASSDRSVIKSYVDSGGHMPTISVTDFVVTNVTTTATNDMKEVPLFYRHRCRFFHYTYGESPSRQIYITDQNDNILKDINYSIRAQKITANVYKIDVFTDFYNNEFTINKVKYNRCTSSGSQIYHGWVETLNAEPLFTLGSPFNEMYEYSIVGPDENGLYTVTVPPVPTLSSLVNSVGISFENSPTMIETDVTNNVNEYSVGVTVKYTLKATGTTTFTIQRNSDRYGNASTAYLQSVTADTWGASPYNFTIGTPVYGIYGTKINVVGDKYLKTGDEAYFTAKRSYYYLMPLSYSAIYLAKPKHVIATDDWYVKVKNGSFRRRMDSAGNAVPSGQGTQFEYAIPEYAYQLWDLTYGPPYKKALSERVEVIDSHTIQLEQTPMYVDPSSVLYATDYPGFAPTGFITVSVNDSVVPATGVLDWDIYNGTVKLAQLLTHRDNITATYMYKDDFYEYTGFVGSGNLYPDTPPFPFLSLDLNPTPSHNYEMYASGAIASIYARPYINVDINTVLENNTLYHNFTGVPSGVYDFKIGSVALGPHCKSSDVKITDVRVRGGGLSKKALEEKELEKVDIVQPEAQFYWDRGYFDGQAVPANGAIVVRIPKAVLQSYGGPFEEDEVRSKVNKHLALGEYIIIEYT